MAESQPPGTEDKVGSTTAAGSVSKRRGFISPTSSFVDFAQLDSEYYTAEGRELAHLYNPHDNRKVKKPTSDFETTTHMLKSSVGAGILAMPKAFSQAGVLVGCIGTILLTSICVYSMTVLITMQYIQCQRLRAPFLTLPRSMRVAFLNGPACTRCFAYIVPWIVDFTLILFQLGICVAYVIFIASAMHTVCTRLDVFKDVELWMFMAVIFIPLCLANFMRNLKKLIPFSLGANFLIVFALLSCLYYVLFVGEWKTDQVVLVASVKTWPLFMGTVLFSLEAVGVVITLEHHMQKPAHYLGCKGILPWSLSVVAFLYFITGNIGYFKWGNEVKGTIFATLPKEGLSTFLYGLYGLCIFLSYPLQCYVALEIMWGNYIRHFVHDPMKECIYEYIMRIVTTFITVFIAIVVPHIELIISLIGAFCLSSLGIILPFLLELLTKYPDEFGTFKWVLIKDIILIVVGTVILVTGTYVSLLSLYEKSSEET